MTTILAIETAGSACSVALYRNGEIRQWVETAPKTHARKILAMIDAALGEAQLTLADLSAIAYGAGPGSFTGLRIGFGVVQGLAFGADLPVVAVSTLQAMAYKAAQKQQLSAGYIVPSLDARMGEVYWGLYRAAEGFEPLVVVGDNAATPVTVASQLPHAIAAAVGDGWALIPVEEMALPYLDTNLAADAASILALAIRAYGRGEACAIDDAELHYVRNEVSWKKHQKIRG